jgi:hypothetical protein
MRESHEPFLVDQDRLTRLATTIERGRGGPRGQHDARTILIERRRRICERVPVHRLESRHAFEEQIDAGAPRLALMPRLDPAASHPCVTVCVPEALQLGVELRELRFVAARDRVGGLVDCGSQLLRQRERGRARAVDAHRSVGERGA